MVGTEPVRGGIELTRPTNAVAAGVLTFIGTFVGGDPTTWSAGAAIVATILATGAGNGINDYLDREIDAINAPDRPLPRGAITPRWALLQSSVMMVVAVGLALTLPMAAIAIALINLVALVTYTSLFKGLPGVGNAVVSFLVGSTFLFGGAAVGGMAETTVLFVLAALATFGREVIKDVEDIEGDRAEGLNTLPIAIGRRKALVVAAISLIIATVASPLPFVVDLFGRAYVAVVIPAIAIMLAGVAASFTNPTRGQSLVKAGMFVAVLAFVIGRVELLV